MTMDSGNNRPDEAEEKPSAEPEGWYFNLPGGAWERQEEKNRELRERVHSNLESPAPRSDPFSAPKKEEKRGFFGRGKKQEEPEEHTTAGGTFRLAKGGLSAPQPAAEPETTDDDGEWSTEPVVPLRRRAVDEAPLPLPSTEWTADDDAPGEDVLSSMRKWSVSSAGDATPTAHRELPVTPPAAPQSASSWLAEEDEDEDAAEVAPRPAAIQPTAPAPSLPLTFRLNRPEREVEAEDDRPSRWKDTFSGGAEETGGLAAMREWAENGPVIPPREEPHEEPTEIPEEFLKPFDWETEEGAGTSPEIPAEFLKPFEWESEASTVTAEPPVPDLPAEIIATALSSTALDEHPWEPMATAEPESDPFLDDLFPRRTETSREVESSDQKQGGVFGRLFGRKKQHEAGQLASTAADGAQDADLSWLHGPETPEEAGWLPAEEPAAAVSEQVAPEVAEAEPTPEANPWHWPSEPVAPAVEESAPAFEAAVSPELESEAEPTAEKNPWHWPAEPIAPAVEEAEPAFEAAVSPPQANSSAGDDEGWDPEPFVLPVPLRPEYAVALTDIQPQPEEPVEEFSFSFEREEPEEERFAAPSVWVAPVALSAVEPADEERPWWETGEETAEPSVAALEPAHALVDAPVEVPAFPAGSVPFPPTLSPTVDEDPWDAVSSSESELAEADAPGLVQDGELPPAEESMEFEPAPIVADVPRSVASLAEGRTLAFGAPANPPQDVSPPREPRDSWNFGNPPSTVQHSATDESSTVDDELDLASSLESQMAIAEDERMLRSRLDQAAANFAPEADPSGAHYEDDDDVLLRAFNVHAATPEPEPAPTPIDRNLQRAEDAAFGELLGAGAADIVAEAADEEEPERSFLKPAPWAALRTDTPENPFDAPWEPDNGQPLTYRSPATDLRPAVGGGIGSDVPWDADFSFGDDAPAEPAAHTGHDRTKTVVREVVETVMLALLVFLCVRASFQNFKVDGSSMYPTLENGQFLIVNKLVYSEVDMEKLSKFIPLITASNGEKRNVFHGPDRGDIVVLQDPRKPEIDLIKRVIGLPGETLEIVDGKVYINDFRLDEPYIKTVWHDNKPKILVPPGQYFVMGDNRDNSLDSRSQQVGFVPGDLIIGKALVSYWPKSKFGLAPNEAGNISTKDGVPKVTAQKVDEALTGR